MHTPQGYGINADGQYFATGWWAVGFDPSMPYRFAHVLLAAYLTTALVVGGVGAWHLPKDRRAGDAALVVVRRAMSGGRGDRVAGSSAFARVDHAMAALSHPMTLRPPAALL